MELFTLISMHRKEAWKVRNTDFIKLAVVVLLSTAFLISFSQIGAFAYETVLFKEFRFSKGTSIGNVDVSNLSEKDTEQLLLKLVNQWMASQSTKIIFSEHIVHVPSDLFRFQIKQSIEQAADGQASQLFIELDKEQLLSLLNTIIDEKWLKLLDIERLSADLIYYASSLHTKLQTINLINYLSEEAKSQFAKQIISEVKVEKGVEEHRDLLHWLSSHPTIEIKGNSYFSLLDYVKAKKNNLSAENASFLASIIYKAVLPTNFEIVERHISRELPTNVEPGFEAKVDLKQKDFIFHNPNFIDYTLKFIVSENGLTARLEGIPFINKYVIESDDIEYFEPKTIVHYSTDVSVGEKRIKQEGKQGLLIRVKRKIYNSNDHLLETKLISEDFYLPIHKIEVHPLIQEMIEHEEEEPTSAEEQPIPSENRNELPNNHEEGSETIDSHEDEMIDEQTEVYEK
jgi:hypothetical protein